jgi:UDP-N-acetylmuramoylalanine--D-glutamate ligase
VFFGENYLQDLSHYDLIFKSAGIPYFPQLQAVADKMLTQVQFFFNQYRGKVIAITASKGKTTMTSLAYNLLKNAGYNVKVVGNIGKPVLDEIDFETSYDYVVIELSSYMLQTLKKQNFLSLLGAFFPEHLDWHGGKEAYLQAKLNILPGSEHTIIFKSVQPLVPEPFKASAIYCGKGTEYDWNADFFLLRGKPLFPLRDVQLLGEHNLWNISAIVALAEQLDIDMQVLHQTIKEFQPVPHRLQHV